MFPITPGNLTFGLEIILLDFPAMLKFCKRMIALGNTAFFLQSLQLPVIFDDTERCHFLHVRCQIEYRSYSVFFTVLVNPG